MESVKYYDVKEKNGKTVKENNMAIKHNIPLFTMVEVHIKGTIYSGIRLYVVEHNRDCDGTPLYSLGIPHENRIFSSGYDESCLTVVGDES